MAASLLVVGATGNTGMSVVGTLPGLTSSNIADYRIIGLTRSIESATAKKLAAIPHVEMEEKDWTSIDAAWLRERNVKRVYIAPHNEPSQFADESGFYAALLQAGVEYVVKISTNTKYVHPTSPVYYGRAHWAVENLLSQPEFAALKWTSLQPNFFSTTYSADIAKWVKEYRETGQQSKLQTTLAEDGAVAMVDPEEVGVLAAHLLALEDPSEHYGKRYVLSGPEDVTGRQMVDLAERLAGVKVEEAEFKVTSWLQDMVKSGKYPAKVVASIMAGFEQLWNGECTLAETPTSAAVQKLANPKYTVEQMLRRQLDE